MRPAGLMEGSIEREMASGHYLELGYCSMKLFLYPPFVRFLPFLSLLSFSFSGFLNLWNSLPFLLKSIQFNCLRWLAFREPTIGE